MVRILYAVLLVVSMFSGPAAAEAKKYLVASDATWPPMELLDDKKNVTGYSADFLKAIAEETGMEFEIRNVAWDGIFAGVAAGNFDLISSSVTITPERQKQFDFSDPYFEVRQALVVRVDSPVKSLKGLKGKKVGGQLGTTGIFVMQKANVGAELSEYEDVGLAMEDLANGRIDAVMCDSPLAMYYANRHNDFSNKFKIALITSDVELYGFTFKKGNTELIKKINAGIKAVKEKGIEKQIRIKWLGGE